MGCSVMLQPGPLPWPGACLGCLADHTQACHFLNNLPKALQEDDFLRVRKGTCGLDGPISRSGVPPGGHSWQLSPVALAVIGCLCPPLCQLCAQQLRSRGWAQQGRRGQNSHIPKPVAWLPSGTPKCEAIFIVHLSCPLSFLRASQATRLAGGRAIRIVIQSTL